MDTKAMNTLRLVILVMIFLFCLATLLRSTTCVVALHVCTFAYTRTFLALTTC